MLTAPQTIDRYYLHMRERCLALAADLDRVARAGGSADDARLQKMHTALAALSDRGPDKARRVQMIFSDQTPAPR